MKTQKGLHICLISVHGLIRANELELGKDADTGGQVLYVVELARALAEADNVARVDLVTRRVCEDRLSEDYGQVTESLAENARILRIEAGGTEYLAKEKLWNHLDTFADNLIDYYREEGAEPDLLHSHYADAGYVGSRLSHLLGIPLVHTGHSLGRVKRHRLLASGLDRATIDDSYNMARRIAAEELTLASAERVITSTFQEIEEQYELYDFYRPEAMHVIPPGTNLSRFQPPQGKEHESDIAQEVHRFLKEPDKPMILAVSRADARKNISTLIHAYGNDAELQERANLVVVMGNRDNLNELDKGARDVLTELLQLIDRYDLYGRVAYPKHHGSDDVPVLYRLATLSGGVFVNPALTEPFGLTLIEAAASGLPIVATEDGGPRDIIGNCENGLLIDPLEPEGIARAIKDVIGDWELWQQRSVAGLRGVRQHYYWPAHVEEYLRMVSSITGKQASSELLEDRQTYSAGHTDRALFTDLNRSLLGDDEALQELIKVVRANRKRMKFCINTGLRLDAALRLLKKHGIPEPDVLIASAGTEITFAPKLTEDTGWKHHIEKQWTPQQVRRVLGEVPGIRPREDAQQSEFKISYLYDSEVAPSLNEISARLFQEDQAVNIVFSHGEFLNIMPIRASKGLALRHVAAKFGIPLERVLAIGGSGADEDMMRGNTLAAIVGNRSHEELSQLVESSRIHFTSKNYAAGILEAMEFYDFLGECKAPEPVSEPA
ncbi:HAD family hydrolase [Granulosicoccus antarcticus]|uniref:sucrose-phosphate synthase n=1 Tax=Granulosicoccus antarcticus IMCC3135 TaxID=1192854 RepID=A0A2Z2NV05_9GAMM|nr:HAD family hydrolase [Granulosicoccus antarcticus]ASJ71497.1 Mannosylfructose-phosphate synthase [Granulosicoccus antarcticus IMCC3135]